jgi:signal recognition particle receptor subunit beta
MRTHQIKLIVTGSLGSGKTTAIAAISEIPVINTDVPMSHQESTRKEKTTVAMDYGELTLHSGEKLCLFGTPGQQRFDYMWQILIQGGLGLIILIDNSGMDPIGDMARYLDSFHDFIQETAAVIGVTHTDESPRPDLQTYYHYLQERGLQLPVFPIDARSRESVIMLIQALLAMLEYG